MKKDPSLVESLRQRIVTGQWLPGMRLPTRRELRDELGVAIATVQRAFDTLSEDGFIDARGAAGTYVAEYPPHLSNYGVLFLQDIKEPAPGSFASVLVDHCRQLENRHQRRLSLYFNAWDTESEGFRRALADHDAHRLAGLVFIGGAYLLEETPLVRCRRVPGVMFHHKYNFGIPAITPDFGAFIDNALDRLIEQGCASVGLVRPNYPEPWRSHIHQAIEQRGLLSRPQWDVLVHTDMPEGARNSTHLLMDSRSGRPDGLVVMDDALLDETLHGLSGAGLTPGRDVKVVSHCNLPSVSPAPAGVQRLGFDVAAMMDTCLKMIDRQRQNKSVPDFQNIPPQFEQIEQKNYMAPFATA